MNTGGNLNLWLPDFQFGQWHSASTWKIGASVTRRVTGPQVALPRRDTTRKVGWSDSNQIVRHDNSGTAFDWGW